ncbi:MAG: shikimate kinase [Streptococcaceae bacterium]|jgi:shikimate kinase|nr:shikimate kinase [Streptococcaceae bacterium]MCH4176803.1 shikimate kinase [Streptococcaceae bacterium]
MSVILIGFMGVGKSTIAKKLKRELKLPAIDMDDLIVEKIGMSISDFFATEGEAAFRELETELLEEILDSEQIISPGGGVIMRERNQELLKAHQKVVFLDGDFDVIYRRISGKRAHTRPIVQQKTKAELRELFDFRRVIYQELADLTVMTSGKTLKTITAEITNWLKQQKD